MAPMRTPAALRTANPGIQPNPSFVSWLVWIPMGLPSSPIKEVITLIGYEAAPSLGLPCFTGDVSVAVWVILVCDRMCCIAASHVP